MFSDFLNIFYFNRKEGIGAVIKALEQKGLFQSLAEPNLIAYNGQEASFLAGGEFPVPGGAGRGPRRRGDDHVQGIRREAEFQADDRRRCHPAEGQARRSARSTSTTASRSKASAFRRSSRGGPRPIWSCATGSRS